MRRDPNDPHRQRFNAETYWPAVIDESTRAIADAVTAIIRAADAINVTLESCSEKIDLQELRSELIGNLASAIQLPIDMSIEGADDYVDTQLERLVAPSDYRPVRRIRVAPPAADAGEGV